MSNIILGSICIFFVLFGIWTAISVRHRWGRKR